MPVSTTTPNPTTSGHCATAPGVATTATGNTRLAYIHEGTTINKVQETHYYPFGHRITPLSNQPVNLGTERNNAFLYNGKEFNDDFGLNWGACPVSYGNYGARFYDAQIGRFHSVDPRAELYYRWSSYGYCMGDPISNVDVYGEWVGTVIGGTIGAVSGGYTAYKNGGNLAAIVSSAAEQGVAGAITGAAIDISVALVAGSVIGTAGTTTPGAVAGGIALVSAAGAAGGALGSVAGDAIGQIVEGVMDQNMTVNEAVSNIDTSNMMDKAASGAISGGIGGLAGGATGIGLRAISTNATNTGVKAVQNNIEKTAQTLRANGAQGGLPQNIINQNVNNYANEAGKAIGTINRNVTSQTNRAAAAIGVTTESTQKELENN